MNLSKNCKAQRVSNAVGVGTGTVVSSTVDTQGFEGVMFLVAFGAITDGTPNIQGRQGQQSNMSDAATLAGTDVAMADADDNDIGILDIYRPAERYVDCQVVRGGATGCVIDSITAILYGPRKIPTVHDSATVPQVETHVSPAEGTP